MADLSPEAALETQTQAAAAAAVPRTIRWKSDQLGDARRKSAKRRAKKDEGETETRATPCAGDPPAQDDTISPFAVVVHPVALGYPKKRLADTRSQCQLILSQVESIDEAPEQAVEMALAPVSSSPGPIYPWIAPLSPQCRMLMSHCK